MKAVFVPTLVVVATLLSSGASPVCTASCLIQESEKQESQETKPSSKEEALKSFEAKTYQSGEDELNYRFLEPKSVVEGEVYPLVIFLHGAGERGDDNVAQLKHGAREFLTETNREKYPCFLIAPQCPKGIAWANIDRTQSKPKLEAEPSTPLSMVMEVAEQVIEKYPVDKSRIYITGLSMGGYGTFDAIERYPKRFAAALPICGGGDSSQEKVAAIKELPIWIFHGGADNVVPTARSREMVEALKEAGGEPKYTEYPGVGHDSWTETYKNPDVLAWLFQQAK